MLKQTLLALAVVTAATAACPVPVHAEAKIATRPATTCSIGYGEDQVMFWDDGGAYNAASTWWRTLVCPLTLDTNLVIDRFRFTAYDRHYSLDVNCRAMATTRVGAVSWGTAATTSGTSPSPTYVALPNWTLGLQDFSINLLCYIPATYSGQRSGLLSYAAGASF